MTDKLILNNGITCLSQRMMCNPTVTINIFYKIGSTVENTDQYGITHFLEHMMFKGTRLRSSSTQITKEIDQIGGIINAQTSYDYTNYYIKVDHKHFNKCIELLSDILFNSLLRPKDIELEKTVVINELEMRKSNPRIQKAVMLNQLLFRGTPYGRSVGGDINVIKSLNRKKLLEFIGQHYHPKNIIISLAGHIPNNYQRSIRKHFDRTFPVELSFKPKPFIMQKRSKMRYDNLTKPGTTNYDVGMSFRSYQYGSKEYYVTLLISSILGMNMSSRLFNEIREKYGLVYSITTDIDSYRPCGSFEIHFGLSENLQRLNHVLELVCQQLSLIKKRKVGQEEMNKGKEYLKGLYLMDQESSSSVSFNNALEYNYLNKIISDKEHKKILDSVTSTDIQKISKEMFNVSQLNMVIVSPRKLSKNNLVMMNF